MRRLLGAACFLVPALAAADTVRVVPWRSSALPEAQAAQLARTAESLLRETSSLALQPALPPSVISKRCGKEDPDCWVALAARAGTDYGLVMVMDPMGGLSAEVVMVDLRARRLTERRLTAPSVEGAGNALRAAIDALVPPYLRRGFGGLQVELPAGARLKVDGKVVLTQPSRTPVPVQSGRHEVDLLLPSGQAVLQRAEVSEGQTSALQLQLAPPAEVQRSNDALLATSAALWSAGTVSVVGALLLSAVVNFRVQQVQSCATASDCPTQGAADQERQSANQLTGVANGMMAGGAVLAGVGGAIFVFDLVQTGGPK